MSQCLPSATNYFITVINSIFGAIIDMTNTNKNMYTLNDIGVGDVYVIEIVASSALGNGSVTTITISKSHTYQPHQKIWLLLQEQVNYYKYFILSEIFNFQSS